MLLEDLFAGRNLDLGAMMQRLARIAASEHLPFGERRRTFNSRQAQELGKWAEKQGRGEAYHREVFRAYFADGLNIGKADQLVRIAASLGLSDKEARDALRERTFAAEVDRDWERSRRLGITAVPTFLAGDRRLVGAQPYEALEALVLGRTLPSMGDSAG